MTFPFLFFSIWNGNIDRAYMNTARKQAKPKKKKQLYNESSLHPTPLTALTFPLQDSDLSKAKLIPRGCSLIPPLQSISDSSGFLFSP